MSFMHRYLRGNDVCWHVARRHHRTVGPSYLISGSAKPDLITVDVDKSPTDPLLHTLLAMERG